MAEISNILYVVVNDAGQVEEMKAMSDTDNIATSALDPSARQALTEVVDSSATWDGGATVSAGVVRSVQDTSAYTNSASGMIGQASAYIYAGSGFLGHTSAYIHVASSQIGTTSALAVTNQTNIATLNTSAVRQNIQVAELGAVSANIATNTTNIGIQTARITEGFDNIGGVSGTSGTDFLGGATPTLSNNLIVNGNYIKSTDNGNLPLSGTQVYLLGKNEIYVGDTAAAADTSGLINIIADLAHTSGTTGGGGGSSVASAIAVFNGSSVDISGLGSGDGNDVALYPKTGFHLSVDTEAARAKWAASPFVVEADGATIGMGAGVDSTFEFNTAGGDLVQTGAAKILGRHAHFANTLSAPATCVVSLEGTVSAFSGITASAGTGFSSLDHGGNKFFMRRDDGATYENLIQATDGTITLQAEDDIHLKANNGEDFARFNENAAVWLYYDNSKKIETHNQGAVVTGGLSATTGLEVSSCPVPNPVCYAQMDGDGTAASTETKFGAGVTPVTEKDSSDQITWDNTNKTFDIAAAGTYHVLATLVFNVAATTLPTIKIKNGTTAKNTYAAHGVHSAEDPEEVTIQAAFTCAASDEISVTFDDDGSTNVNLMAGSAVTVRRLF